MTELQRQYNRAKIVFSTNGARTIGHACAKKKIKNLDKDLTVFTNIITNLNVRGKTVF